MKVTVLVDNNDGDGLKGEWGLSFYIQYKDKVVLLDAGLSPLFARNADKMGIDLKKVDMAVLSHAHDDHVIIPHRGSTPVAIQSTLTALESI